MGQDLEDRFINLVCYVKDVNGKLGRDDLSMKIISQINRSSLSCLLNYGEARSAESTKDFIHKMSIIMKELRETMMNLKVISKLVLCQDNSLVKRAMQENDELLAIVFTSIQTARKSMMN